MLLGRDKPKRPSRKLIERRLYSGTLRAGVLYLKRGAHIKKTNADGEVVKDFYDPKLGLMCGLGDKLVISGNGDATVIVRRITPGWNESLHLELVAGSVADGTVFVMNAKGLRND